MRVQEAIKLLRLELGLSQRDFADKLHMSYTTINRWETGKAYPSRSTANMILELANKMQVSDECYYYLNEALQPQRMRGKPLAETATQERLSGGLFEALSNASDNVYIFENDLQTGLTKWSDSAVEYFALPDEYVKETIRIWAEKVHPEDRPEYLADINGIFSGEKTRHCVQYRAKNRYDEYVWVECTGNVIKDANGTPILFAGIITRLDSQNKYDPLTKQLSMHQFYLQGDLQEPAVVLIIGMDEFRKVIHNYSYEAGNKVLCILSEELQKPKLKKYIYRMEGDGFLIVLPHSTEKAAKKYFDEVKKKFQNRVGTQGFTSLLAFSGGAVIYDPGEYDKDTLIRRLEHSMEQAKLDKNGKLVFFSEEIEEQHNKIHEISRELENAIQNNFQGFEMFYQPIETTADDQIRAVEALLRFHSKALGWITPSDFIPILENTRTIRQMGMWVMEQAVKQCKKWNEKFHNIKVGFNVSYLQLYDDSFIKALIKLVQQEGVNPGMIAVELTESCKVMYPENLAGMFQKLIDYGFKVALDDFGMEYSSLTLLRDLPITTVKIDHSFVRTLRGDGSRLDKANLAIVSGIIKMCKELQYFVVVEGIETKEIGSIIRKMDVDFLQGYYYSKPVPPQEVEKFFSKG